MEIRKNIHNTYQGPLNPGFFARKSTKRGFSKKTLCSKYSNYEYATIGSVERFFMILAEPGIFGVCCNVWPDPNWQHNQTGFFSVQINGHTLQNPIGQELGRKLEKQTDQVVDISELERLKL